MQKGMTVSLVLGLSLAATTALGYTEEQADNGQKVYAQNCSACHGANGQGGRVSKKFGRFAGMKAPRLVGQRALPHVETADNVFAFIKKHMPLQKPGSLSDKEYLDIVAFVLKANKVESPNNQPLTEQALPGIVIHKAE